MIPLAAFIGIFFVLPLALARWNAYCLRVALGIDLYLSAITNGRPGETLSGRCGTALLQGKRRGKFWAPPVNLIMGSRTHVVDAIQGDMIRAQAVIADDSLYPRYKPPSI